MFYYVYILQSLKDNKLYIGFTSNLKERIKNHSLGLNKSTANRRPLKLIYYEAFIDEKDVREKEKFYKSGHGHEVIKKILKHYLAQLADPPNRRALKLLVGEFESLRVPKWVYNIFL